MSCGNDDLPLVSIGMPVRNGGKYLRQALDSLLMQDYANFELVISDNASEDSTLDICRAYQMQDARISVYNNDRDRGAVYNFNRVFALSRGTYFMWAAHDNLWDRTYISKCVRKMEEHPSAAVCISEVSLLDERGGLWDIDHPGMETTPAMDAAGRMHLLISRFFWYEIYGLLRTDLVKKTQLFTEQYGPDLLLLMELLLLGEFVKVPAKLFFYRRHCGQLSADPAKPYIAAADSARPFTGLARNILRLVLAVAPDNEKGKIQSSFITCLSQENTIWRSFIFRENQAELSPEYDQCEETALRKNLSRILLTDTAQ